MEEMTCKVVDTEDNEIGLEVIEKKTSDVVAEREQKIKEVARVLYGALENLFTTEKTVDLGAEDIIALLQNNAELKAKVLDGMMADDVASVLSEETKKQIVDKYLEDVDVDELDGDFFERVGTAYVEENASDIARDSYNKLSSWEQKDFIKDCIDDL